MEISREIALEVFGLKDGFTQDELNKEFRKLSKLVHPDVGGSEGLFKFIKCCKENLVNNSASQVERKTQPPKKGKERARINLSILYDDYYDLGYYTSKYEITEIYSKARVYITPTRDKKQSENISINLTQPFYEFRTLGFANFSATVTLPESFQKFKKFNVRVEFNGETFKFKISRKNPFHIVKDESVRFNTVLELNFKQLIGGKQYENH